MSVRDWLKSVTPGGAQTRSKRDLFDSPQTISRTRGSRVWDDYGVEYLDWCAALASVGLGYGNSEVDDAVIKQINDSGTAFPLPSRLEGETAETLLSVLRWPEQVRWIKTGSEATEGAMLIARLATGRRKVVSIGYHGHYWCHLPGPDLVTVPWGSQAFWTEIDCSTAAVLLEPMRDSTPPEEYLRDIRHKCIETGALFIMDEIVTGFRWAIGGATEHLKLEAPDLACYGKAMANGYPIAAIVGKRDLMKHASEVSSTFGGEGVGLAAAQATIGIYQREPVIARLWEIGERLMKGVPELRGYPVHPHLPGEGVWGDRLEVANAMAQRGVLTHPSGFNPMYAHSNDDVDLTIGVLRSVLDASAGG